MLGTFAASIVIGIVEVVLAISFAASSWAPGSRATSDGIGLYLVAAALAVGSWPAHRCAARTRRRRGA
jgi:hypothetical protein